MQTHLNAEPSGGEREPLPPSSSRRTKLAMAGVAMASAGALALTPVIATPTLPDVQVDRLELARADAYGLTAFQNPLELWGETFDNLVGTIVSGRYQYVLEGATGPNPEWVLTYQKPLIETVSTSFNELTATLARPDVQAGLSDMFSNAADPERWLDALSGIPGHVELASSSLQAATDTLTEAFTSLALYRVDEETGERLPSVLQTAFEFLAEGEVFKAYSEINYWFLVDGLSSTRGDLLDAFKIPGNFLTDLGLEPLGRILGNSDTGNDGLLGRTVIGNFGRAVLAPPITAIFQTVEIIDTIGTALQNPDGPDFETAVSELINAPAKLTNAFLSGYVPGPLMDFELGAGRGQAFPGIFSPTGPFDFLFNQVPAEIIRGITPPGTNSLRQITGPNAQLVSATDTKIDRDAVTLDLNGEDGTNDEGTTDEDTDNTPPTEVVAPVTEGEADETGVVTEGTDEGTDDAVVEVEEGTADEASDAKELTSKDRISLLREQAAEKRAERVEQRKERISNARDAVQRVGSNIRKGLGLQDRAQKPATSKAGNDGGNDDSGKSESSSKSKSDNKSDSSDD